MSRRKGLQPVVNTSPDGKTTTFLRAQDTGIMPLILAMDGVPLTFLGKSRVTYVAIDEVIGWHERELPHTKDEKLLADRTAWITRLKEISREASL